MLTNIRWLQTHTVSLTPHLSEAQTNRELWGVVSCRDAWLSSCYSAGRKYGKVGCFIWILLTRLFKYHHFVPDFLGIAHALLVQDAIAIVFDSWSWEGCNQWEFCGTRLVTGLLALLRQMPQFVTSISASAAVWLIEHVLCEDKSIMPYYIHFFVVSFDIHSLTSVRFGFQISPRLELFWLILDRYFSGLLISSRGVDRSKKSRIPAREAGIDDDGQTFGGRSKVLLPGFGSWHL